MSKLFSTLLVVILLVGGGGYALATVADAATPGDPLYSIDLVAEDIQRAITVDDLASAQLEQDILEERAEEIEQIVNNGVEESTVQEALQKLEQQRDRTQTRVLKLTSGTDNYDEAKKAEVINRYMKLVQTQIQKIEQVQIKYQTLSGDPKKGFEDAVVTLESLGVEADDSGVGNEEKNDEVGDSGDGIKDRESNSDEDTGNKSGNASQTGR